MGVKKEPDMMYLGTLGLLAGVMGFQLIGPDAVNFVTAGAGLGAMAYSLLKSKDDLKLLLRNTGLFARDLDGEVIFPKILKKYDTKTGYVLHLSLPYGLTTLDFERVKHRLEQHYDADIEIEYKCKQAIVKVHTKKLPEVVEFTPVETKPNQWIAGLRHDGEYEIITFDDALPHMFCAGMTGWGKTNFININLYNANIHHTIDEVEYWLVDLKGGAGFAPFENARLTKVFCNDVYDAGNVLFELKQIADERIFMRKLKGYNTQDFKPIFCIIDEYPDLIDFNEDAFKILVYLARKARAANVHVIITTQRASREYLPGVLKCNLAATMCFGCKTEADSEVILGQGDFSGALITNRGRAIFDTPSKRVTVQVPYIPEKDFEKLMQPYTVQRKPATIGVISGDNATGFNAFGIYQYGQGDNGQTGQFIALPGQKSKRSHSKKKAKRTL